MIPLSPAVSKFDVSPTLKTNEMVTKRRSQGEDVLHMGFGYSPFPVPERLKKALADAADRKEYLPTSGLPELCDVVKSYYVRNTGLDGDAYDVVIAPGSKLILYALQMAVEGDLIMPVPSWVSYYPQSRMLGHYVIKLQARLDDEGYHIDADHLRRVIHTARQEGKNPRKLILNSPSNPTGLKIPEDELKAIAAVCVEEDVLIISDEIYGFVSYDGTYSSISKYAPTHVAISTGLSKSLSLGGWRVGVCFVPKAVEGLYEILCSIASEVWSCASSPIQQAVIPAFENHDDIENHITACSDIHGLINTYIAKALRDFGVTCALPQGAFYNYPDFSPFQEALAEKGVTTSEGLSDYLIKNYGLAVLPGLAFGEDASVLTMRLAGCDYDGEAALAAYQAGASLDDGFIDQYAPRVIESMEAFGSFVRSL